MGKSEVTTRNSLKALEGQGLIVIYARYLKNGARLENEYELTPLGERALRLGLQGCEKAAEGWVEQRATPASVLQALLVPVDSRLAEAGDNGLC
ncbi:hypothetical protein [Parolsenella catena]|uniref:hypothetical protein n=2 Tax=Parolsenella catena TaxID=2003188 RepID=UPI002FE10067